MKTEQPKTKKEIEWAIEELIEELEKRVSRLSDTISAYKDRCFNREFASPEDYTLFYHDIVKRDIYMIEELFASLARNLRKEGKV